MVAAAVVGVVVVVVIVVVIEVVVVVPAITLLRQVPGRAANVQVTGMKLVARGFLRVLRFPPLLHGFNGSANKIKLK